jgi:hypothetical protein
MRRTGQKELVKSIQHQERSGVSSLERERKTEREREREREQRKIL